MRFIRKYNLNVITWTEAFLNYDKSIKNNEEVKQVHTPENHPDFFVSHMGHEIENLKPILKDLNCNTAHLYINLSSIGGNTFGKHKDSMAVYYWQCQGISKWTVWSDQKEIVVLSPGDLIYCPANMYHEVIPLTPRFGLSMAS